MAQCKTVVTPLLMHWSYCSLELSHWYNVAMAKLEGRSYFGLINDLHRQTRLRMFWEQCGALKYWSRFSPKTSLRTTHSSWGWAMGCFCEFKLWFKQVQLERLRSENTPALSPMNKFKNIIQVTPRLILETTIEHFDKWTDKSRKPKQRAK